MGVLTGHGALLMQAVSDPDTKQALARLICDKRGLTGGTSAFARCVMALQGRDRALSPVRAAPGRMRAGPRPALCMTLGDFTLTRCIDI